jgi:protein SCO1/2
MGSLLRIGLSLLVLIVGCGDRHSYTLRGQILAVDRVRRQVTVRHDAIVGLMDAMTMPFNVRDDRLLTDRTAGDLIRATLVVSKTESYLSSMTITGHSPVPEAIPDEQRSGILKSGSVVADAQFVDETGTPRSLQNWAGKTVALTFIYTRCPLPDFCPRMNRNFGAVQSTLLSNPALREQVRLISVTLDPDFDTPPILAAHARRAGADASIWSFLTGTQSAIDRFAVQFGVYVVRDDKTATVTHNLRTAVIGPDGRLRRLFEGSDWKPTDLLASLSRP